MKYCTSCGAKITNNMRFCGECGAPINEGIKSGYDKREQVYAGKLIKCPSCGEVLSSFEIRCPSCGYELREAQASSVIREFAAKLEAIENSPDLNRKRLFAKKTPPGELSEKEKRKIDLIRSFPIPNTREDLYEFLVMASSNIDTEHVEGWDISSKDLATSDAWRAKYEQAYQKAKISFGESQEFKVLNSDFQKRASKHSQKKKIVNAGFGVLTVAIIGIVVLGWIAMIAGVIISEREIKAENKRLELILDEVNEAIEDGNYSKARTLTSQLVFSVSSSNDSVREARKNWDNIRKELYEAIEKAEEASAGNLINESGTELSDMDSTG